MHKLCNKSSSAHAAIQPKQLCLSILRGLHEQLIGDKVMTLNGFGTVCEETSYDDEIEDTVYFGKFVDNISGKPLSPKLVHAARMDEVRGIHEHKVWDIVPVSECFNKTGKPPIKGRWVDINKGDDINHNYRSKWVGQEFRVNDGRDDLFAATPPLEAIKALISLAASQCGSMNNGRVKKIAFIDISKAYCHAPAQREMYVQIPDESLKLEDRGKYCGRLNYSLYGTRDAATNWESHYTQLFFDVGFKQGVASPCIFSHVERDVRVVVHGDDFTVLATQDSIDWLAEYLGSKLKLKLRGVLGPDEDDMKQITILNRIVTWGAHSLTFEADTRHGEIVVNALLEANCNSVVTPGTKDSASEENMYLAKQSASLYRACAARLNFLSQDRPEIQYAVKEVCRGMSNPTNDDLVKLKRIARYIKGAPRATFSWVFQSPQSVLNVYSDSDWAGCERTRKSTQGGVVLYGNHCIRSYSSTQATIALSSAEAEYYALVKAGSIALGMRAMYFLPPPLPQLSLEADPL